jgi:membrane protease subunit (stomatin/prohibitin family)
MNVMRVFEVYLRSGAKAVFEAEALREDSQDAEKIYFYGDTSLNQVVAYFNRTDIAGILFGEDKPVTSHRKSDHYRR